jgi:hypothetical protein
LLTPVSVVVVPVTTAVVVFEVSVTVLGAGAGVVAVVVLVAVGAGVVAVVVLVSVGDGDVAVVFGTVAAPVAVGAVRVVEAVGTDCPVLPEDPATVGPPPLVPQAASTATVANRTTAPDRPRLTRTLISNDRPLAP